VFSPAAGGEGVDPNASFHPTESAAPTAAAPSKPIARPPVERAQHAPAARKTAAPAPPPIPRALLPAPGETRFRPNEVVVELPARIPNAAVDALRRRHRLDEIETARIGLIGDDLRLWRAADRRSTSSLLRELDGEPLIAAAQPNYVYALQDAGGPAAAPQYALRKLRLDAARTLATGDRVLVAMVDTAVDDSHPDLKDAILAKTDTIGGALWTLDHGTAIAGAIAGRGAIEGAAPKARLLAARAFEASPAGPQGTTLSIAKAVDWAVGAQAKIVNMSFAGPPDPELQRVVAAASTKGVLLVAAAGNAGPKSPPLYPAADAGVVAVTAVDAGDKLFENANRGKYVALAAPGVDILLPAPNGGYDLKSGTSVAAAFVSGVAALLIERNPSLKADAAKKTLVSTARPLAPAGHEAEFGAGLVDALQALGGDKPAAKTQ
jgi:subtilisin family serine protease